MRHGPDSLVLDFKQAARESMSDRISTVRLALLHPGTEWIFVLDDTLSF